MKELRTSVKAKIIDRFKDNADDVFSITIKVR